MYPHLTDASLGQLESKSQTAYRSVQPFYSTHYCDRQSDRPRPTDRSRYSVYNNRPHLYVHSTAMRPDNKISLSTPCFKKRPTFDSLNLVINVFSSGLLGAWFRRKRPRALQQLDCVAHTKHLCVVFYSFLFRKVMLKHYICEVGKQI